jgi:hypothetical protein
MEALPPGMLARSWSNFNAMCLAVAWSTNGSWAASTKPSQQAADEAALNHCRSYGGQCTFGYWACDNVVALTDRQSSYHPEVFAQPASPAPPQPTYGQPEDGPYEQPAYEQPNYQQPVCQAPPPVVYPPPVYPACPPLCGT